MPTGGKGKGAKFWQKQGSIKETPTTTPPDNKNDQRMMTGVIKGKKEIDNVTSTVRSMQRTLVAAQKSGLAPKIQGSLGAGAPFGLWTPLQIPGLFAWYDASTIVGNNNDAIAQWNDLSGNARHLTQPVLAKRPILILGQFKGRAALSFDGVQQWMAFNDAGTNLVQPFVMYAVTSVSVLGGRLVTSGLGGANTMIDSIGGPIYRVFGGIGINQASAIGTYRTFGGFFNGASSWNRLDGVQVDGNAGAQNLTLGIGVGVDTNQNANFHNGFMTEIVITSGTLSAQLIALLELYLRREPRP